MIKIIYITGEAGKTFPLKYGLFLYFFITLALSLNMSFAEDSVRYRYGLCVSIYFDIQNLKRENQERLKLIEMEIQKNAKDISDIKRLLAEIQKAKTYGSEKQRRDAIDAEIFAQKAFQQLKERDILLRKQKTDIEMSLNFLKNDEDRLDDLCNKLVSMKSGGLVKKCSGTVKVINGEGQERSCSNYMILREGDTIYTGSDGSADLYIVGGRGTLNLSPNTRVSVLKETPNADIIEVIKGKTEFAIEKIEDFRKKTMEWWKRYKEDIRAIQDWTKNDAEKELKVWICKKGIVKDSCFTPYINIGVRGTIFRVEKTENHEVNIYVLEGVVDATINLGTEKKVIKVKEGNKLIIIPDGTVTLIEKGE